MPIEVPPFNQPCHASLMVFVIVVAFVCGMLLAALRWAGRRERGGQRRVRRMAALLGAWLALTALLAETGVFAELAESGLLLVYVVVANGLGLVLALGPLGKRIAMEIPVAALIAFQGFRLPLELVLHSWYRQGAVPVQMTYSGDNYDIVTGIVAPIAGAVLAFAPLGERTRRAIAWGANVIGFVLLLRVMNVALRSTPGPLRSYLDTPPLLVAFHAPYTWILPICVAGALAGHVIVFRQLWGTRR